MSTHEAKAEYVTKVQEAGLLPYLKSDEKYPILMSTQEMLQLKGTE